VLVVTSSESLSTAGLSRCPRTVLKAQLLLFATCKGEANALRKSRLRDELLLVKAQLRFFGRSPAILHAVPLSGVCRKGRSSPVPQVRERPEEMRCVGSKRTRELGRDMLLAASIVKNPRVRRPMGEIALCLCLLYYKSEPLLKTYCNSVQPSRWVLSAASATCRVAPGARRLRSRNRRCAEAPCICRRAQG
jgi:hypothetical protein